MQKKKVEDTIHISEIEMDDITFNVVGISPMIMNRFSLKAWQELLFPAKKANRAEKEQSLKHDPLAEFRGALYLNRNSKSPARFHVPNGMFHGALASAALDIPGATKSKIERLTKIVDVNIDLFGVPHLFMAMVRNSDINRTPDVRTRPIFPEWACRVTVRYVKNILTQRTVASLLGAAGHIIGIGDWRGEKGGPYGSFRLAAENDAEFKAIIGKQGAKAQQAAYDNPIYFDEDTAELMGWFQAELVRRERKASAPEVPKSKKGRGIVVSGNGRDERYVSTE